MKESNDEIRIAGEAVNSSSVNLLDFPTEVLLRIFQQFGVAQLMDMSHVCTRFEAIACEAYSKRYNGESEDKKIF